MSTASPAGACLPPPTGIVGILLAAGRGVRFGGDKLLAQLPDGRPVAVAACANLLAAVPEVVAVVRPDDVRLAAALARAGATVVGCSDADRGMGHSLACGVRAAGDARGWVIALADMPWIAPATIRAVAGEIAGGAPIVVPRFAGERAHPVGFAAAFLGELTALQGDQGARSLLRAHATRVVHVDVADRGAIRDVDTPADLAGAEG